MNILLTNDDGIQAPALQVLGRELETLGRVTIVVPDRDQSATSHSLTLHRPVRANRRAERKPERSTSGSNCVPRID